jgi:hypothetical protein
MVFGGRILSRGDSKGASGHIQIANTWLIVNVGVGPTPDKPSVTLSVPAVGLRRVRLHCPPACAGLLLGGTCDKVLTVHSN